MSTGKATPTHGSENIDPHTCKIDGCGKKRGQGTRGYCCSCYARAMRLGLPRFRIRQPGRICSVEGCGKPYYARGYCHAHADRFYRYGAVDWYPIPKYNEMCDVKGCDRKADTKGMCDTHYRRQLRRGQRANLWGELEIAEG